MLAVKEIYWLAGLMEGEGYFGLRRGADVIVQVSMTDRDVIEKIRSTLGFGTIKQRQLPSGLTAYCWSSTNQTQTAGLMMTVLPLMGDRRARRICDCLAAWKPKPLRKSMWTHCKNGHELSEANTRLVRDGKYLKRRCIECGKLRQRKHRARLYSGQATETARP